MLQSNYAFFVEIADEAGQIVHREEVSDFLACSEDLLFSAVCSGAIENDGKLPAASVEPIWSPSGQPAVAGVAVNLPQLAKRYGLPIFADRVWQLLVDKGLCREAGMRFTWQVEARPRDEQRKGRFRTSVSREPYPIEHASRLEFGVEQPAQNGQQISLFVASSLLDELRHDSASSLEQERADVLSGHLVREPDGRVALLVTARTPAVTDTDSSLAHFSFSPLTFVAVQKEIARRGDGTTICGWFHNHPPPCGCGCLQVEPPCKTQTVFFSTADRSVHRTSFPAPYMIALVGGKEADRGADQPVIKAYGWQDAVVCEREFGVF